MTGRYFLDTNIFVYSFDAGDPVKAKRATLKVPSIVDAVPMALELAEDRESA